MLSCFHHRGRGPLKKKIRTQIQLEAEEYERLAAQSRRRGVSMSHIVRESLRRTLGLERGKDDRARQRFMSAAGIGKEPDDRRDVARNHDDFIHGS